MSRKPPLSRGRDLGLHLEKLSSSVHLGFKRAYKSSADLRKYRLTQKN